MKTLSLRMSVTLPAGPEMVFTALSKAWSIARWSGQKGSVSSVPGGRFEMFDRWVRGKVLEFKRGKVLAYSWLSGDWPEGAPESIVRYTFAPVKGGTRVNLVHTGFPNDEQRKSPRSGWKEFVFKPLNEYLAQTH